MRPAVTETFRQMLRRCRRRYPSVHLAFVRDCRKDLGLRTAARSGRLRLRRRAEPRVAAVVRARRPFGPLRARCQVPVPVPVLADGSIVLAGKTALLAPTGTVPARQAFHWVLWCALKGAAAGGHNHRRSGPAARKRAAARAPKPFGDEPADSGVVTQTGWRKWRRSDPPEVRKGRAGSELEPDFLRLECSSARE